MSDAQLACLAIAAAPLLVGTLWALGDLAGHVAAQKRAPSPARVARLTVGLPLFAALWVVGTIMEAAEVALGTLLDRAERGVLRLRDWMDA